MLKCSSAIGNSVSNFTLIYTHTKIRCDSTERNDDTIEEIKIRAASICIKVLNEYSINIE